jgi:hypothetical protein
MKENQYIENISNYKDEDCPKNYHMKNKQKDYNDKKSRCNINNNINLYTNNTKNNSIDCKPKKDKKYGCCCDTTKLREMLLVFKQNNTPVIIFTETLPRLPLSGNDFFTPKYIHAIINDMVYISNDSSNGAVIYIIPLCNISFVIAISPTPVTGISNIINEIMTEATLEKNDCCCMSGIGNTLNSLSNFTLLLPLSSDSAGIASGPDGVLVFISTILIFLFIGSISTVANDDIYVIYSESTTDNSFYIIVPTCKIDVLFIPQNLGTTSRLKTSSAINSPILNSLLSLLNEDMRAKIEKLDIDKLSDDIKGKSMDEILKKIKSIIE